MRYRLTFLLIFLTGITAACSFTRENLLPAQRTSIISTPDILHQPTASAQKNETFTPIPTRKIVSPIPAITKTPLVTVSQPTTKVPTLSGLDAKNLIVRLQDNKDCQLPCLWGLTPGIAMETARSFSMQFGNFRENDIEVTREDYGEVGGVGLTYLNNNTYIALDFAFYQYESTTYIKLLKLHAFALESVGISSTSHLPDLAPVWGSPDFGIELKKFSLASILARYGKPSEAYLAVWPNDPTADHINYYPFSLVLIYWDQGIFIEYELLREQTDTRFIGCPEKFHVALAVWDPKAKTSLQYIAQKGGIVIDEYNIPYFKPIEAAILMTMDEFYEKFKDGDNTTCLSTPKKLWQSP